jgi:hypothetical protein
VSEKILLVLASLAVGGLIVWLLQQRSHWRGSYFAEQDAHRDALDRAVEAEVVAADAQQQLDYLKKYIVSLQNKPVVAILNDSQFSSLVQNVCGFLGTVSMNPKEMS